MAGRGAGLPACRSGNHEEVSRGELVRKPAKEDHLTTVAHVEHGAGGRCAGIFQWVKTDPETVQRDRIPGFGLIAAPALELSLDVVQSPAQAFDGSRDVADVIAGEHLFLVRRRRTEVASCVRAIWQPITLVAEAESVSELEVDASPVRVSPDRGTFLGDDRRNAQKADDEDRASHCHSMTRSVGPVEHSMGQSAVRWLKCRFGSRDRRAPLEARGATSGVTYPMTLR